MINYNKKHKIMIETIETKSTLLGSFSKKKPELRLFLNQFKINFKHLKKIVKTVKGNIFLMK